MRRQLGSEQGAVAAIVAVLLVVLMGFAALAVDVGYWYDTRHQLQAAADAAALAGCSVLIETDGDTGAADAAARDYAARNANGAGVDLVVEGVEIETDAEPWSVRVVVARDAQGWFSAVLGADGQRVRANARAVKAALSGVRNLMPWAIPIIRDEDVDRIEATLVDDDGDRVAGPTVLSNTGAHVWQGALGTPTSAGGYDVKVVVYNVFGIAEWVGDSKQQSEGGSAPAARVMVDETDYPFASISLANNWAPSDQSPAITVNVTTKEDETNVRMQVDGKGAKIKLDGSGKSWSYTLTSAQLSYDNSLLQVFPIDLFTGANPDGLVDAYAYIRRSTFPFASVTANPSVGSGGSTNVTVNLNEFNPVELVPGQIYTLRVGADGVETGNFGELNFGKLEHNTGYNPAVCPPDPVGVPLGNNVKDWVEDGYGGGVHIGDIAPLSPGKSGWTPNVVKDRIEEHGDIVTIPIVTKYQQKSGGSYDVIVRAFASMRIVEIENGGKEKGTIEAEFLEYVATPSSYGGGSGTAFAARLVNP